jgi:hypothetical protein
MKTIGRYATRFEAALEYARRIGPDQAKMEAAAVEAEDRSTRGPRKEGKQPFIGSFTTKFEAALTYTKKLASGRVGGAKATPVAQLTARQMSREGGRGASAEGEGGAEVVKCPPR